MAASGVSGGVGCQGCIGGLVETVGTQGPERGDGIRGPWEFLGGVVGHQGASRGVGGVRGVLGTRQRV